MFFKTRDLQECPGPPPGDRGLRHLSTFAGHISILGFSCWLLFGEESCWLRKGKRFGQSHRVELQAKADNSQTPEVRGQPGAPKSGPERVEHR